MKSAIEFARSPMDEQVAFLTRHIAAKSPRRSFLGKLGRLSLAAVAGSAAAVRLLEETAYGHSSCCGASHSVSCSCLTGVNGCPSGTCECGCWSACDAKCGDRVTRWCDCCDTSGCTKDCVAGCNNEPKCCFHKPYSGGCGTIGETHVRCRKWSCTQQIC